MPAVNKRNPGCCGCGEAEDFLFTVRGCFSLGLKNATVSVWTDSGKGTLLGSGTTDASGQWRLPLSDGSYYAEVEAQRFNTLVINPLSVPGAGRQYTADMVVAAGYHCTRACLTPLAYPLLDTLEATNSLGAWTLAYTVFGVPGNQTGWVSPEVLREYDGCGAGWPLPCPPAMAGTVLGMPIAACPVMRIDASLDGFDGSRNIFCPHLDGPGGIVVQYGGGNIIVPFIPSESEFMFRTLGTGFQPPSGCCRNCMFPPDDPDELIITE